MKVRPRFAIWVSLSLLATGAAQAKDRHGESHVCSQPSPQAICTAENTCGSASAPCIIDVKRGGSSASMTPSIPGAKGNAPFCVRTGTTITWQSSSKNTGFTVDFGSSSPFDRDGAIIGGSDRSVSVVAKKEGCYKVSFGACIPGAIYGMCAEGSAEVVITGAGK